MALSLRSRLALIALIGLFLIPIFTSSLNGLTHVVTCTADSRTPFTIDFPRNGQPTIASAEQLDRAKARSLCGGLAISLGVSPLNANLVRVVLPITNHSRYRWHGTVRLVEGGTSIPVGIGSIGPGATRTANIPLQVPSGATNLSASLLVGP